MRLRSVRFWGPALLMVALLWPVIVFGFPMLYWDSVDYLLMGQKPSFGAVRPPAYAWVIRLLHGNHSLWPIVIGQAGLAAWLIRRTLDALSVPDHGRLLVPAVVAVSSLPFFIIWVMADVLTGLLVLAAFVAVARPPRAWWERILLAGMLVGGAAAHVTHMPLLFGIGLILLLAAWAWPALGLSRQAALGVVAAPVLAAALLVAGNLAMYGVARITHSSPVFALARLIGDGLAQRTLAAECPARGWRICAERAQLDGVDSGFFMFSDDSPLNRTLGGMVGYAPEAAEVVAATLRQHWPEVLRLGLGRARETLLLPDAASDSRDAEHQIWAAGWLRDAGLGRFVSGLEDSPLVRNPALAAVSRPGDLTSLAWAPLLLLGAAIALRRRAPLAFLFVGLAGAAIIGSAVLVGIGGEAAGRYQGRVAWLAPFACALALLSGLSPARREHPAAGGVFDEGGVPQKS